MSHEYQIPNLVLDETDKQILTILHEEGRISYTDLGKRVDLS
ncbi:chromate efflux transcriptional regulator ChrS, partial [Bacillus sp. LR--39]